tara:strand:- start:1930 stop:2172 length:243 start_codon:yes stop_codon:yes gene_type:complete
VRVRFDYGQASRVADVAEHALANKQVRFIEPSHWPDVALAMPTLTLMRSGSQGSVVSLLALATKAQVLIARINASILARQ